MRTIARFMDARNTAEGKFLSVLLSVLLVFSFLNVTMFTDLANADDEADAGVATTFVEESGDVEADEDVSEVTEPEQEPATDPEPTVDEAAEEVNTPTEPETEVTETTEPETEEPATPETPIVTSDDQDSSMDESNEGSEAYPAQRLTAEASDGTTIVVTAPEGALPANSSMRVQTVSSRTVEDAVEDVVADEGKTVQDFSAYSIMLLNEAGDEIVPAKKVRVSIQGADVDGENVEVVAVSENGAAAKVAGADANGDASFQAAGEEAANNVYVLVGTLEKIEVPDITQKSVTVKVVYSNGVVRDVSAMALSWNEDEEAFTGAYELHLDGFTVKSVDGIDASAVADDTLNLSFLGKDNTDPVVVTVVIAGEMAEYTVRHYLTALDGTSELKDTETLEGTVGVMTTAEANRYEGFTADAIQQAQVKADSSTVVDIIYKRNTYKLTYDTAGGSYIAPKTGQFEEEVEAFGKKKSDDFVCGKVAHETHVPAEGSASSNKWKQSGCYLSQWVNRSWQWVEKCPYGGIHKHSDDC